MKISNNTIEYQYNDGIRTSKTINNQKKDYYLEGNKIILEKRGQDMIYYIRNEVDDLIGFQYQNQFYYYMKNIQNDIVGILDQNGNKVATYTYDSWGNILSIKDSNNNDVSEDLTHIASINPFRYRSYYYDVETKLYYLNSRYYNPLWGRFLNADKIAGSNGDIISYNLYLYCSNNPIIGIDENGLSLFKVLSSFVNKIGKCVKKVIQTVKNIITVKNNVNFSNKPSSSNNDKNVENLPDYTDSLNKVLIHNAQEAFLAKKL